MAMNSFSSKREKAESLELLTRRVKGKAVGEDPETTPFAGLMLDAAPPAEFSFAAKEVCQKPLTKLQVIENRSSPRSELKLTVLISNRKHTFRAQTLNVSMTGLLMNEMLPAHFMMEVFDLVLVAEQATGEKIYIRTQGTPADAPLRNGRISFKGLSGEAFTQLTNVLNSHSPS